MDTKRSHNKVKPHRLIPRETQVQVSRDLSPWSQQINFIHSATEMCQTHQPREFMRDPIFNISVQASD